MIVLSVGWTVLMLLLTPLADRVATKFFAKPPMLGAFRVLQESRLKLMAGIVTGIGFLGAGIIFRQEGGTVEGLTTAAGLWATAALGVVVGVGQPLAGIGVAALVLLLLIWEQVPGLQRIGTKKKQ